MQILFWQSTMHTGSQTQTKENEKQNRFTVAYNCFIPCMWSKEILSQIEAPYKDILSYLKNKYPVNMSWMEILLDSYYMRLL